MKGVERGGIINVQPLPGVIMFYTRLVCFLKFGFKCSIDPIVQLKLNGVNPYRMTNSI